MSQFCDISGGTSIDCARIFQALRSENRSPGPALKLIATRHRFLLRIGC